MWKDKRSGKIILVAHCILNQNSRVFGLARFPGMINEIINVLKERNVGILQMPCPELLFAGLNRWSRTKEQYDTPIFRRYCRKLAITLVDQIEEYLKNEIKILAILGIDGSPTCGVNETSKGFKGGDLEKISIPEVTHVKGLGIFMEELQRELKKRSLNIYFFGIKDKNIKETVEKLENFFKS